MKRKLHKYQIRKNIKANSIWRILRCIEMRYKNFNAIHLFKRFIPGPRPLELRASGFIRKFDSFAVPYYQFLLEFGNYSYQIMIPCKTKDGVLEKAGQVDFVQIPGTDETALIQSNFGESSSKLVDMRKRKKLKMNVLISVYLLKIVKNIMEKEEK